MSGDGGARESAYAYMKSRDADGTGRCGHCEGEIDTTDWYPVATRTDADGVFRIYQFCGDDCRNVWTDD